MLHRHFHQFRDCTRIRVCLCVCVFLSAVPAVAAAAGATLVTPESLSPVRQPLAVLRTADPAALLDLLAGSAAKPFAPAEFDFAGRLPGLGAEVASATDFLKALAAAGARDVWYCLLPGAGLSRPVAGMGWQLPAGKETTPKGLAAWLEGAGLRVGGRALSGGGGRSPAAGGQRVAVGPDDGTLRELTAGSGPERWRRELAAFMVADAVDAAPTLGVWANPRPLLGLASMFADFDARGELGRLGLAVPESIELALLPAGGGCGLSLRLARVLPGRQDEAGAELELFRHAGALLQLHLPGPAALRLLPAPAWTVYLPLLNLNPDALTVQAASAAVWRGRDGELRWLVGALFPDAAGFDRNWRKLLAAAGDLSGIAEVRDGALGLRLGGEAVWLRPSRVDGSAAGEDAVPGAVLVAASRPTDLPVAVAPVRTASGRRETAARWEVRLDWAARTELAEEAARLAAGMGLGKKLSTADLLDAIPARETGALAVDGDSLLVTSDSAATFFITLAGLLLR